MLLKEKEYYKMNSTQALMTSLAFKPIIEHPTILIVLPSDIDKYNIAQDNAVNNNSMYY